ncbi:MAG: hypothetical protein RL695_2629 [Pseudomonadota bacterium]|jgi:uncharacterized LabA/DUF88 family protein
MATLPENTSMAVFCDFENVALGVRDAKYEKFDIKPVLERLLLKGSIVVKKSYCDWDRYKSFKAAMHEANFELIEIPHVRQSGKNSADIRLVVDALDLCYTKSHVNTFVIISGDSDFSPLVSKLRENAKQVIGVGVKQSTSDLLVANCDEFIFYDDLVRETRRAAAKRERGQNESAPVQRRTPEEETRHKEDLDRRRTQAIEIALETFEALIAERGDSGKIWASMLKQAVKRRKPDFNENYYGFRTFGNLVEEAQSRGLLEFGRDEKSGLYVYRSSNNERPAGVAMSAQAQVQAVETSADRRTQDAVVPGRIAAAESLPLERASSGEEGRVANRVAEAPTPQRGARKPARQRARAAKTTQTRAETGAGAGTEPQPLVAALVAEPTVDKAVRVAATVAVAEVASVGETAPAASQSPVKKKPSASKTPRPRKQKATLTDSGRGEL